MENRIIQYHCEQTCESESGKICKQSKKNLITLSEFELFFSPKTIPLKMTVAIIFIFMVFLFVIFKFYVTANQDNCCQKWMRDHMIWNQSYRKMAEAE
jgi:uncharacterized membrane protein YvbJ